MGHSPHTIRKSPAPLCGSRLALRKCEDRHKIGAFKIEQREDISGKFVLEGVATISATYSKAVSLVSILSAAKS